jgi:hypothetical protein
VKKWHYDILKFQIGCVYFFGGIAKLKYDWLILGQPMKIWLVRNSDFPILGGFFTFPIAGYLFSYAGLIFDLTVAFLLLTKKRVFAYLALLFFHLMTAMLFPIGMFPWVMIASSILFLEVDYFENKFNFLKRNSLEPPKKENFKLYKICICMYIIIQIFLPLRHFLYPGNLNWTEEGFRFSWNIMVMQKNGDASFRILERETKKSLVVYPKDFLTENQVFMMSTQPDMILQFAHYLKRYFEEKSGKEISVFADVFVSLNGREAVRFIHPEVDLGKIHESFLPKKWILPAPP